MACGVQPLVLEYGSAGSALSSEDPDRAQVGPCLLCREEFNLSGSSSQDLFKHLLESHKLVIADADRIANLQSYIEYWRPRLKKLPLESVCVKMEDMTAEGPVYYYMLSSVLKEDRLLRSKLIQERLKKILNLQQLEREDNSKSWCCLFCGELITGNRSLILGHMKSEHNFNIGHPDNLVHVEAFLNKLRDKLDRLLCLYCEKTFKDKLTLKEHMRKKLHKKLNPRNQEYDKFYLINYLEMGCDREPKTVRRGRGGVVAYITTSTDSDAEEEWQEETDENATEQYQSTCLFCPQTAGQPHLIFTHMAVEHSFHFPELMKRSELNFYHQIKIINYIRRQMLEMKCLQCNNLYEDKASLMAHLLQSGHLTSFVEDRTVWDQPEYYFPTYENDNLLVSLQCAEESFHDEEWVIPEDVPSSSLTQRLDGPAQQSC